MRGPDNAFHMSMTDLHIHVQHEGLLSEGAFNSNTIHQAIIEFKGQWYFIYHNGAIQAPNTGGSYRRSVCIDYLHYNPDGTMKRVIQTTEGVSIPPAP